jgi:hypothetical protein
MDVYMSIYTAYREPFYFIASVDNSNKTGNRPDYEDKNYHDLKKMIIHTDIIALLKVM